MPLWSNLLSHTSFICKGLQLLMLIIFLMDTLKLPYCTHQTCSTCSQSRKPHLAIVAVACIAAVWGPLCALFLVSLGSFFSSLALMASCRLCYLIILLANSDEWCSAVVSGKAPLVETQHNCVGGGWRAIALLLLNFYLLWVQLATTWRRSTGEYYMVSTRLGSTVMQRLPKLEQVSINLAWTSTATYQNYQRSLWFSARSGNKTIG